MIMDKDLTLDTALKYLLLSFIAVQIFLSYNATISEEKFCDMAQTLELVGKTQEFVTCKFGQPLQRRQINNYIVWDYSNTSSFCVIPSVSRVRFNTNGVVESWQASY